MTLQEKNRSLMCGLPAGLYARELDGETVLYLDEAPFELTGLLLRWLRLQPDLSVATQSTDRPGSDTLHALLDEERPDCARRFDASGRTYIRWDAWQAFLSWTLKNTEAELYRLESDHE
jgi:hypothetical protein